MSVKLTVELGQVNRTNWGAPEDVTLLIRNAAGDQVATVRYEFLESEPQGVGQSPMQTGTITCESNTDHAPGEAIMLAAYAMKAVYDVFTGDHEFLTDVFEDDRVIEFEM